MRTTLVAATLALLSTSVSAALCKKGACNADNCLRAVRASSASPGPSVGLRDCSSFMQTTITPCGSTTTTTTTQTVTASPSTQIVTAEVTAFPTTTLEQTVTVVTTVIDTAFVTTPTEVDVPTTVVVPVTVTAAQLTIFKPRHAQLGDLYQRSAPAGTSTSADSTCAATTQVASSVPIYASACSGVSRYSSACSCAGVTGTTVTVASPTVVTKTSTSTSTYTPTVTQTQTQTAVQVVTEVDTQTQQVTFETTGTTITVASAFTQVVPVTVTSTVFVSPPAVTGFLVKVQSGPGVGKYIYINPGTSSGDRYIFFTSDVTKASRFMVDPITGYLQDASTRDDIYFQNQTYAGVVLALDAVTAATRGTGVSGFACVPSSTTPGSTLTCSNNPNGLVNLVSCGAYLYLFKTGYVASTSCTIAKAGVVLAVA